MNTFWTGTDPGGHRFINGKCYCGQLTTNDPSLCPWTSERIIASRPAVDNMVIREKRELAAWADSMDLVDLEAEFLTLQVSIRAHQSRAIDVGNTKRAEALENCLLGVIRARTEFR